MLFGDGNLGSLTAKAAAPGAEESESDPSEDDAGNPHASRLLEQGPGHDASLSDWMRACMQT